MSTVTDLESYQQFAQEQQAQNNAWSAEQAQKQMDFQKMMSDTAHQREVADLKAAGLNPILSANTGAAVTQGASAEGDKSTAGNVGAVLQQVLSAQSAREVAAMYNSATIYAAQLAANASMYGADMSYKNTEDHPKTLEEVAARLANGGFGDNTKDAGKKAIANVDKIISGIVGGRSLSPVYNQTGKKIASAALSKRVASLPSTTRQSWLAYLKKNGIKNPTVGTLTAWLNSRLRGTPSGRKTLIR